MISNFKELFEQLRSRAKKRVVGAWAVDDHTITAIASAVKEGIVESILVGDQDMILDVCKRENIDPSTLKIVDNKVELKAIAQAVDMINAGEGDILMKGLGRTDKYLRAILNKEKGLLPPKAVLTHVTLLKNPLYHKFLLISDIAIIPAPDLKQKIAITKYLVNTAHALGIEQPKVAMLAASEQMLEGIRLAKKEIELVEAGTDAHLEELLSRLASQQELAAAGYDIIGVSKDKQALQKKFADAQVL